MSEKLNILISGDLSSLAEAMALRFSYEKHKVILAGPNPEYRPAKQQRVTFHTVDFGDVLYQETLSSYKFDAVIYIATREECIPDKVGLNSGSMLDGLLNSLDLSKNSNVKRFFYVSSTEVFGNSPEPTESTEPEPRTINGFALSSGEMYCKYFNEHYNLNTTIIRVPHIYGKDEKKVLLSRLIQDVLENDRVIMPGPKDVQICMLHSLDVVDFVLLALGESENPHLDIVNLTSTDQFSLGDLSAQLSEYFPSVTIEYDSEELIFTRPADGIRAKEQLGWISKRNFKEELPGIIDAISARPKVELSPWQKFRKKISPLNTLIKWAELGFGAVAVQYLTILSGTLLQFKYIDFRLLYVVLMGSIHGTKFGLFAAILASAGVLLNWYQTGLDFSILFYNIENWLPFTMYLIAGGITGYLHDKKENEIRFQNGQYRLIREKYRFLYGVYDEISLIKDKFREQLMGYRDSYGRIYSITTQLNTLHEEDIMFRALSILEDILENDRIALYSLDEYKTFGRLQVCSQTLKDNLSKSIKLTDFPDIVDHIDSGTIYQNTSLQPNYPAYFAPIIDEDKPVAGVAIWEASFDQYSLKYYNLIKIICGLIQDSLVRAALFKNANSSKMYIPKTQILQPEAFKQVLSAKKKMQNSQISEYELIKVFNKGKDWEEIDNIVAKGIRSTDYVGLLDDGHCYILLTQTDWINAFNVLARLEELGLEGEIHNEGVLDVD